MVVCEKGTEAVLTPRSQCIAGIQQAAGTPSSVSCGLTLWILVHSVGIDADCQQVGVITLTPRKDCGGGTGTPERCRKSCGMSGTWAIGHTESSPRMYRCCAALIGRLQSPRRCWDLVHFEPFSWFKKMMTTKEAKLQISEPQKSFMSDQRYKQIIQSSQRQVIPAKPETRIRHIANTWLWVKTPVPR